MEGNVIHAYQCRYCTKYDLVIIWCTDYETAFIGKVNEARERSVGLPKFG